MTAIYTESSLKQMKGQAVKDIWHAMIGKPAGIKNTTGLKNSEEIIQAILEGQRNPDFVQKFIVRAPKQTVAVEEKEMPPKSGTSETKPKPEAKKRGPKPKPKPVSLPQVTVRPTQIQAYESTGIPIRPSEITRISVKKIFVGDSMYFIDSKANKVYENLEGRPGACCGLWNAQKREVQELDS